MGHISLSQCVGMKKEFLEQLFDFRDTGFSAQKIFYYDVETTGLVPGFNEICQFAGILEVNNIVIWKYKKIVRPEFPCRIHPEAVKTHGITVDKMMQGISQAELHYRIRKHLSFAVNPYDSEDKAVPCAFNGTFDYGFLAALFESNNDRYLGSLFNHRSIDPLGFFRVLACVYDWKLENMKLETIANALGISIDAHDAMSDTEALREVVYKIRKGIIC